MPLGNKVVRGEKNIASRRSESGGGDVRLSLSVVAAISRTGELKYVERKQSIWGHEKRGVLFYKQRENP